MSVVTKQHVLHKAITAEAQSATRALLSRYAPHTDWLERDLLADQPTVRAQASLWAHDEETPVTWEATTPLTTYTVLLLLDDSRLALHSDAYDVQERACDAGSYYVSRPGEKVGVRCPGKCRAVHIAMPVELFWSGHDANLSCFSMGPARDALLLQLARTLLEMQGETGGNPLTAQVMDLLVDRLCQLRGKVVSFAFTSKKTALPNWRLQRLDSYVRAHLSEHITLNDMAAATGLSPMHFAAQFRAATGYRPHHYLLLCRMEHAKRLMANKPRSMLDVALETGFQTQSHFTTVFKRITGKTPSQWRDEMILSRTI